MNRKLLIRSLAVIVALAAVWFFFFRGDDAAEGGPPGMGRGGPGGFGGPGSFGAPAVVRTQPVEQGEFEIWAEFVGTLKAEAQADLYAKLPGQIVEMRADTGDRVRKGQVLARIDPGELGQRIEQMEAALRMARATLGERRSALDVAQATADRTESLYDQELVSQQQQDTVHAELLKARSQVQVAEAQIEQAQANLGAARAEHAKSLIVAPFAGVVGKRHLDLGAFAATNRPVFTLVDLSTIRTTIPLTQKDAARIEVGQTAQVTSDAFPGTTFTGRVARISSVFDPSTNTTEAEVEIDNPDGRLKPGMFATVAVAYRTEPTALLVPKSALVENERESFVFVAEKAPPAGEGPSAGEGPGWKARRVPVTRLGTGGEGHRDEVAVEGRITAGEPVITLGQQELRDGAAIVVAGQGGPEERTAGAGGPPPGGPAGSQRKGV